MGILNLRAARGKLLALGLAVLLTGLAGPAFSADAKKGGKKDKKDKKESAFTRDLKRKKVATVEDVIRSIAQFRGYKGAEDTAQELEFLKSNNVTFGKNIAAMKAMPITKGNASHLFLRGLGHKGSLTMRVAPWSQRAAVREAMAIKILPKDSIVTEKMSGADLLSLLTKIVDYKEKKQAAAGGDDSGE